jgi:hypothetical protein
MQADLCCPNFMVLQAKFVAVLIVVPWVIDFVLHDFVLVPFLET